MATASPRDIEASGGGHPTFVLDVRRDETAGGAELATAWLSVIYVRHSTAAYNLALRILGDPSGAEVIVERAFLGIAASTPPTVPVESVGRSIRVAICRLALACLRSHRPPRGRRR